MQIIITNNKANWCSTHTSPYLKNTVYHELGNAQHNAQAGCAFWDENREATVRELTKSGFQEPYGNGSDTRTAPILAITEMWGNHVGYTYNNLRYGNTVNATSDIPGSSFVNSAGDLDCFTKAIENHNPNLQSDINKWIPQGLPHDLIDDRNDISFTGPVNDNVLGYNNSQIFNSLQSSIRSIPSFRNNLLQQNGNNQSNNVNLLFGQYGY